MDTFNPSAPLPLLVGVICMFALILLKDEFKKTKDKN
jgi:hypothetical protein